MEEGVKNVKIFVRGAWVDFSPVVIKSLLKLSDHSEYELFDEIVSMELNELAVEITGGKFTVWPTKKGISPSVLTPLY